VCFLSVARAPGSDFNYDNAARNRRGTNQQNNLFSRSFPHHDRQRSTVRLASPRQWIRVNAVTRPRPRFAPSYKINRRNWKLIGEITASPRPLFTVGSGFPWRRHAFKRSNETRERQKIANKFNLSRGAIVAHEAISGDARKGKKKGRKKEKLRLAGRVGLRCVGRDDEAFHFRQGTQCNASSNRNWSAIDIIPRRTRRSSKAGDFSSPGMPSTNFRGVNL